MVSSFSILVVILSVKCCFSWHCTEDVNLTSTASISKSMEYTVNTHPDMDPSIGYWMTADNIEESPRDNYQIGNYYAYYDPRSTKNTPVKYWGAKMNFFWFGYIQSPSALIIGGLYEPVEGEDDRMVYGAVINCDSQSWMTVYQNSSMSNQQMWKQGDLNEACVDGASFDLIFEMTQESKGSFIFNSQPLEDAVYPLMKKNHRLGTLENSGLYRTQKLPINLTLGTRVHGSITDGYFIRYAYGKCYAVPTIYNNNCIDAKAWIEARNKVQNMDLVTFANNNAANEPFPVTKDSYKDDLGALGMNNIYATVGCYEMPEGSYYNFVQSGVHADHNSDGYPIVCCAYMNGTLAESTCESYKTGRYMACLSYSMWYTKYEGLEAYYVGDLTETAAATVFTEMNEALTEYQDSMETDDDSI